MSQIMKAYMALFLLLLMAVSAMGIVTAQMQLIQAENMHKTFMTELAGCNLDSRVMENCFERAKDIGCNLCITFYKAKGKIAQCKEKGDLPVKTDDVEIAKVELETTIQFPVFQFCKKQKMVDYIGKDAYAGTD